MMKPTSITEAHSNFGTYKERNRWESCKQAQSSRQWKVRHNGWKLVATYPAPTIFVYYHVLYPSTTTTFLLLARILVDSGFLRQLLKSNSNQYRNFLVDKNGLDGSWTHDLSNAMKLDEPFFLSRMKGKEDRASKLWYPLLTSRRGAPGWRSMWELKAYAMYAMLLKALGEEFEPLFVRWGFICFIWVKEWVLW